MVRSDNHDTIIITRFSALKWRWWRRWRWRKEWEKEFYWEIPAASLMVPRSEKGEYLSRSEKRRIFLADLKTQVFFVDDRISQCGKLTFSILLVSLRRNLIWSPAGNSRREKGETWKNLVIAFTLVTHRGFKHCPRYFGRKTEKSSRSLWKIQTSPLFRLIR